MSKRIIAIVAAVTLAAVGTIVLVLYVRSAEDRALAGEETVEVLVLDVDVPRGTAAETLGDRTRLERIPVKVQAEGAVADLDVLAGQVTTAPLVAGEQLIAGRFVEPAELVVVEIPDGLLEITVSLSPDRVVGGVVEPGDTVAVFSSFENFPEELEDGTDTPEEGTDADAVVRATDTTHLILHKVLVSNVQGQRGRQTGPSDVSPAATADGEEEAEGAAPSQNLLVTLAVDAPSAERVVFTAEHGTMWLALEPDDAPEDGTRIQTEGTIYQ